MARPLFCFPNHVDTATISAGSYLTTLPADNVKDRRPRKVARSSDATTASTQGSADFGSDKRVRAISLHGHNLSLAAQVRFVLTNNAASEVYNSGWVDAFPAIYPSGATILGEDVGSSAITSDQWASGKDAAVIDVLSTHISARYLTWEIDDTANTAGYVDVGRVFAGPAWQPETAGIQDGADFAYFDPSTAEILAGSSAIIRERVAYKTWGFDLAMIESDEARTQLMEFRRQIGKRGQFLFVFDPADALNLSEFSFLARCDSSDPATISHQFLFDSAFSIVQEV